MDMDNLKEVYDFSKLPSNLQISTLSACSNLNTNINLVNIDNYMKLDETNIITIKYGKNIRSLENKKRKPIKKTFFNQLTMEIYSEHSSKKINLKLFKNGSIQMCGCKAIEDCIIVLNKLISKLKNIYATIENNKIIEYPFIDNFENIKIKSFKIILINSNYKVDYLIKREKLYNILISNNQTCRYEPCIHACVNIKYNLNDNNKPVSIFVFQSGNIIITGAKTLNDITKTYNFIDNILEKNKKTIIRKDIYNILQNIK